MPDNQYKTAHKSPLAAPASAQVPHGQVPALADSPAPAVFLNPGPKLLILALAICVMSGYAHFRHELDIFSAPPPPGVTAPPPSATATTQPQAAAPVTAPPQETSPQPPQAADDPALAAQRERVSRLSRTPRLLSGQTFANENLNGLSLSGSSVSKAVFTACTLEKAGLHNMRLTDCRFDDVDLSEANIREVTFENCVFENTALDGAAFFNVNFINCSFTGTKRDQGFSKARIALARMYNVAFENAKMESFLLYQVSGRVSFKNSELTGLKLSSDGNNRAYPKIDGNTWQLDLRLDECRGGDFDLEVRNLSAQLKITRADFDNVKIRDFTQMQIEDSSITGQGYIVARDWLVVKNSRLCADLTAWKSMYLLNNSYLNQRASSRVNGFIKDDDGLYRTSAIRPKNGAACYIMGGADGAWLATYGGRINISDLKIRYAYFELDNSGVDGELNLKNVSLERGHIFNSELAAAYWENVKIAQPMTSRNARTQKPLAVRAVKLSLPQGAPWIDSNLYSIEEVSPRAWPRPEIPQIR